MTIRVKPGRKLPLRRNPGPVFKACRGCKRDFNQKTCKICPYCKWDNGPRNRGPANGP